MPKVKLQTSDDEIFEVDYDVAKCLTTIRTMLEDLGFDEKDDEVVPLPNVTAAVLKGVLTWAEHHKDDPPLTEEEREQQEIPIWDAEFLSKIEYKSLFDLITAANYLDIEGLVVVGCKVVANMIRGKTPEQIREQYKMENDFTPEEEEQIRRENEWFE